jgi:hypothetical protein
MKSKEVIKHREHDAPDPGLIIDGPHCRKPSAAGSGNTIATMLDQIDTPYNTPKDMEGEFVDDASVAPADDTDIVIMLTLPGESSPHPTVWEAVKWDKKPTVHNKDEGERGELKKCASNQLFETVY